MAQRRATAPWNGPSAVATRPGRPRKNAAETNGTPGCVWPIGEGTCGGFLKAGLAVCAEHGKILASGAGRECAWPPCSQFAAFRAFCPYHEKVARGLLKPLR